MENRDQLKLTKARQPRRDDFSHPLLIFFYAKLSSATRQIIARKEKVV
jgi:hypothetical protein